MNKRPSFFHQSSDVRKRLAIKPGMVGTCLGCHQAGHGRREMGHVPYPAAHDRYTAKKIDGDVWVESKYRML
jgi:hypothetical protein